VLELDVLFNQWTQHPNLGTWPHLRPNGNPALNPLDVTIGAHVYVGARSTLVGCALPDRTVVGAGSVVTKQFAAEATPYLIAGNPAIIKKRYQANPAALASVND
jgi:acetyltransferase-like isoleucine patch superfamily enzyme